VTTRTAASVTTLAALAGVLVLCCCGRPGEAASGTLKVFLIGEAMGKAMVKLLR